MHNSIQNKAANTSAADETTTKFSNMVHQRYIQPILSALDRLDLDEKFDHNIIKIYSKELAEAEIKEAAYLRGHVTKAFTEINELQNPQLITEKMDALYKQLLDSDHGVIERINAGRKYRIALLGAGERATPPARIKVDPYFFPQNTNFEKVNRLANCAVYQITSGLSAEFVESYSLLSRIFPTNEMDPSVTVMKFLSGTINGKIMENEDGSKTYLRNLSFILRDELGEISNKPGAMLAAANAIFSATRTSNSLYIILTAVPAEHRQCDAATLLRTALISRCNEFAMESEAALGTSYQKDGAGKKIMATISEVEFPELRKTGIVASFRRLIYFGKNDVSLVSPEDIRYRQPDCTYPTGLEYDPGRWTPIPMSFAIRPIGGRSITFGVATDLLKQLGDGLIAMGLNKKGILADRAYALEKSPKDQERMVQLVPFPKNKTELSGFLRKVGSASQIKSKYYSITDDGVEPELSVEDAIAFFESQHKGGPIGL